MLRTINAYEQPDYQGDKTSLELRYYANKTWIDSDGQPHVGGRVGSADFFQSVTCSVSAGVITIPSHDVNTTTDASHNKDVKLHIGLWDDENNLVAAFVAPSSTETGAITASGVGNLDLGAIIVFNDGASQRSAPQSFYDYVLVLLDDYLMPDASTLAKGGVKLSKAPSGAPTAVGINEASYVALNQSKFVEDYASLSAAVAALSSGGGNLVVSQAITLNANLSIPVNVRLSFIGEGMITVGSGKTLTVGAMDDPGNRQVFAGTGTVKFSTPKEMNLAWLVGPDDSVPSSAEVKAAIDMLILSSIENEGGIIFIPPGFWETDGGHVLSDTILVKGAGQFTDSGYRGTCLKLKAGSSSDYIFKIGEGEFSIYFQDILIDGNSVATTDGVYMEGQYPNTSGTIGFDRVTIANCTNGFRINSLASDWQVAQVGMSNTIFAGNTNAAIKTNSVNGQITTVNTNFNVPAGAKAFDFLSTGLCTFVGSEFAGAGATSKICVISGSHGAINFVGCQDENFGTWLQNDASDTSGVTNFSEGCLIQSKIQLNQSCKVNISKCNLMSYAVQGAATGAVVNVRDCHIRAVSVNDGVTVVSPPVFLGAGSAVRVTTENLTDVGFFKQRIRQKFVSPTSLDGNPTVPVLEVLSNTATSEEKVQLRVGRMDASESADYYYDIFRKYANGRLQIQGNQTGFVGLDFNGDITATNFAGTVVSPAQITSNQNNYAPTAGASYRLSTDASRDITGLSIGQASGWIVHIYNVGAQNIVLKHNTTSTAANRFLCNSGADITIPANGIARLFYDATDARWRATLL